MQRFIFMKFNLKKLEQAYYKPVLQSTLVQNILLDRKLNLGFKGILKWKERLMLTNRCRWSSSKSIYFY